MTLCVESVSPAATKKLGVFRKVFPKASETFITEPTSKMVRYEPTFITCRLLQSSEFPTVAISHSDRWGIKQAIYLLSRSPQLFPDQEALSKLDMIHSHFGPDGIYAMTLAKMLQIPFLVTFHGWDITVDRSVPWKVKSPLYYQLLWHESELKHSAAGFIAVSKFVQSKLLEKGYPPEKIIQHYIGVDTDKFSPADTSAQTRYLLCVGRHTEKKGIDTLLKAFAQIAPKHPDVSLIQVGSGPLEANLRRLADVLGIGQQVQFLGARPHSEVQRLMQGAEVFVLPSQTAQNGDSEALGIVFHEASASGKPIVSTLHGGIPEVVLNEITGFLVPERDDQKLAKKIDVLLSNRSLAAEMGKKGRKFTCENFDIRVQTAKLETIYDSILSNNKVSV